MKGFSATGLIWLCLLALCLSAAPVGATTRVLLNANFNDKPLNSPIGTGGPGVGEPIFVHPSIEAKVRASPMTTPALLIRKPSGMTYSNVVFDLPGSGEILDGDLRVAFTVRTPATSGNFLFRISAQGDSAFDFGRLELESSGKITATDASGSTGNLSTWAMNQTLKVEYIYHLQVRTYDLRINNELLLGNWPHGVIAPGVGIGRLVFATDQSTAWVVDDLFVTHTRTLLLEAISTSNISAGKSGHAALLPVSPMHSP